VFDYACTGAGANDDHCCYVDGKRCQYLVENEAGRRYACGLMLKYGSWEAMNASTEYRSVGVHWAAKGRPFNYCETFDPAFCCRPEYRDGRRYEGHVPVDDADRYDGRFG
jgi:hypothetical protein